MAETSLCTLSDVIDALGGNTAVARLTGSTLQAVSNWTQFGRFPAKTFLVMANALRRKRKTADAGLWGMLEPQEAAE